MQLTPKTKRIIAFSSGSIFIVALLIWYFFPVLLFNWFWFRYDDFHSYLSITPVFITELKKTPEKWKYISIDNLKMSLPANEFNRVCGKETSITFIYDGGSLYISFINNESRSDISYKDELEILGSTPDDISFFNSRKKNIAAATNQIAKAMAIPNGGLRKVFVVNGSALKAISILSENRDTGYGAITSLYSPNKEVCISLILKNYQEKTTLESDLLSILGGIIVPNSMPDPDNVRKDIQNIVDGFNRM